MNRNTNIERLRFLAAVGILWFHQGGGAYRDLAYSGLPVFLMVYAALIIQRSVEEPFREFVTKRFMRLLLPWIFWSLVYAGFLLVKYSIKSRTDDALPPRFYLIGSCIHLWFLPYAFLMGLLLYGIHQYLWARIGRILTVPCVIVIAFLVWIYGACSLSDIQYYPPFSQWVFGFPGILLGAAIGYSMGLSVRAHIIVLITVMVSSVTTAIVLGYQGEHHMVTPYGVGIPCVCLAFLFPGKSDPFSHFLASLTYGVYLIHPMIGAVFNFIVRDRIPVYGIAAMTLIGSILVVAAIQRTPLRRFV